MPAAGELLFRQLMPRLISPARVSVVGKVSDFPSYAPYAYVLCALRTNQEAVPHQDAAPGLRPRVPLGRVPGACACKPVAD
jgi:hypothetical protein